MTNNRIKKFYDESECDPPQPWEESGCGGDVDEVSLPPEVLHILESQQFTYQAMSYAAMQKMILAPTLDQQSKPLEIPQEIGLVTEMTKRLFPDCAIKTDMIDGEQFNESPHVLIRVIWPVSNEGMSLDWKNEALLKWHSELFNLAPDGAFRLQVEYPE